MPKTKIKAFKCNVCGHTWPPRGKYKPLQCPNTKCRSHRWDRPKDGE